MPESGSDGNRSFLQVENGSNGLKRKSFLAVRARVHVAWVIVPFLFVLALQAVSLYWLLGKVETKPHMTVVIDLNGTQNCAKGIISQRACKKGNLYISSQLPIGPLRCHDDAFAQSEVGHDNCQDSQFRVAKDGLGVVIPKDGLYRLYAKVAYYDSIAHHTSMMVRIDSPQQTECLGNHDCLAAREKAAHSWLTCQAHQPAVSGGARDFTSCAVDGVRRFSAGQKVGLQVSIGHREIVGHRKATYMYIHML